MQQPLDNLIEKLMSIQVPDELSAMAESGEVRTKITQPTEVAFAVHRGSYSAVGETIQRLVQWIIANEYTIAGPPVNVFYNDPMITAEADLITEVQFPIIKQH